MKRLIITGGTGYIGSSLINLLKKKYEIIVLTRQPNKYKSDKNLEFKKWDGESLITHFLNDAYGVINLIGENIGKGIWTAKQKVKIIDSRFHAAFIIKKSIENCTSKPKVWIQASATGIYGPWNGHDTLYEDAPNSDQSFLADVCEEWERPIKSLTTTDVRKIIIRTGVVLSKESEFMKKFLMSFSFGVATIVGSGENYVPWIHLEDEVNAIRFLLENESCAGVFNLSAPNGVTTARLVDEIKEHKKSFLTIKVPKGILDMVFGREMVAELVLANQKVYPQRLLKEGFKFKYLTIQQAMQEMLG